MLGPRQSSRPRLRTQVFLALLLMLATAMSCNAIAQQTQTIRQMVHTSWTGRNGAPQGITALAQTPDGRLWIGTVAGLYSFDGYSFKEFALPFPLKAAVLSRKVQSLFVSRDGGLWVIGLSEGAVFVSGKTISDFGLYEGKHARFDSLQQDSRGRIWAVLNDHSLAWWGQDRSWHVVPGPVPNATLISGIFFDSFGTLWAVVDDHLYRRAAGEESFQRTDIVAEGGIHFAETFDHTLWIVGQTPKRYKGEIRGLDLRHFDTAGQLLSFPFLHSDVNAVLVSQGKSLWVLENDIGRYGARTPALTRHEWRAGAWQIDRITSAQGLGDSDSHAMVEDVDGSIWVGGERQLERFRPATLVSLTPGLVGSSWILCANPGGGLWVGSRSGTLLHISHNQQLEIHGQDGPYKLLCRKDGSTWMLDARGVSLVRDTTVQRFPLLAAHGSYLDNWGFSDLLETDDHRLLVAEHGARGSKLWEWSRGRWVPFVPALEGSPIHASFQDTKGTLYFGKVNGSIVASKNKQSAIIPILGGTLGGISAFQQIGLGTFALGSDGIALLKQNAFQRLSFAVPEDGEMVSGIVQSADGDVWVNGRRGIVRIPATEIQFALNHFEHRVLTYEVHEGDFVGPSISGITSSSAVKDATGTLWFATLNGVVSLNASAWKSPVNPPELRIESADADGHAINDRARLAPHVATVRIRYLGLNLTRPEDVIYSYRLEGVDQSWQSVGRRTEAVYTGLTPGIFRFLVKASYGDGSWTSPVELRFQVLPAFYQTWWFRFLCLLFFVLISMAVILLRLRFLAHSLRERAEQRADERIRIARDLHDTLLQGVQGLLLNFHVAAQAVPSNSTTRHLLERALQSADRLIIEGRNRVSDLRGVISTEPTDLLTALKRVGEELNLTDHTLFQVRSSGESMHLESIVFSELFYVGREALTNAFRHSRATSIEVLLHFGKRHFTLICRDNGRGLPEDIARGHSDRWGLRGMIERVQRLGGTCLYESSTAKGTTVTTSIPATRAYQNRSAFEHFKRRIFQRG